MPTKEYVDWQDNLKANVADVYDKDVMDQLLADKAHITHTHTVSDITGLSTQLATIEANVATNAEDIDNLEDDVSNIKDDILSINNTLTYKADLVDWKIPSSQLPDTVVTVDNLADAVNEALTKSLIETKLGVSFRTFVVPINGTTACVSDSWISERCGVLWTWEDAWYIWI